MHRTGYVALPHTPDSDAVTDPLSNSGLTWTEELLVASSPPATTAEPHELQASPPSKIASYDLRHLFDPSKQRRAVQLVVILAIAVTAASLSVSAAPWRLAAQTIQPRPITLMQVGPRPRFAPNGRSPFQSCSYDGLLKAIKGARYRDDAPGARPVNMSRVDDVTLRPIEWSFDLPPIGTADGGGGQLVDVDETCTLHIYTQEEACELLSAFGGLFSTGDSFGRHVYTALLTILRNRNDGAVKDYATTDDCRGEHLINDGKLCRDRLTVDTNAEEHVCGNAAQIAMSLMYLPDLEFFGTYRDWQARQPRSNRAYSPVLITALGIHFNYDASNVPFAAWLEAEQTFMEASYPAAARIFLGPHHPPANQPAGYIPTQGPAVLAVYKAQVERILANHSSSLLAIQGGWRYLDTWQATERAVSYDGGHYGVQVNLEKAYMILGLLDALWNDIAASGGLVEWRDAP